MPLHVRARIAEFATKPASARPLAVLRIGIALTLIGEAAILAPHLFEYYHPLGLVQSPINEAMAHWSLPSFRGLARVRFFSGVTDSRLLQIAFAVYVVAIHFLLLGWHTRIAAIVGWLLFLSFKASGSIWAYGAFEFAHIALFYCVVLPVGDALSIDAIRKPTAPSRAARVGLRVLQLHLCIVYLASGLEKASGDQWWNGEAIWRALMRPGHVSLDFSWLDPRHAIRRVIELVHSRL